MSSSWSTFIQIERNKCSRGTRTKADRIQQNSFNLAPTGPDRCCIIQYSRSSDSTYTDLSCYRWYFITATILDCTTNQRSIPFRYLLQLLVQGHQCFPASAANNHRHSHKFSFRMQCCKILIYNTMSICINLDCFNVCCFKVPFTLSLDAINNRNWSFCFYVT